MKVSNGNGRAFMIRCYRGDTRRPQHKLSKSEADKFRTAARHLIRFLERSYQLGRSR